MNPLCSIWVEGPIKRREEESEEAGGTLSVLLPERTSDSEEKAGLYS